MKLLIVKLSIYVIIVLSILLIMEYLLHIMPTDYSYKKAYLEENIGNIETLILGHSYAYDGINPEYFDDFSFSMAYVNQPLYFDNLLLDKYINKMPKLQRVILPVSFFSLNRGFDDIGISSRKYDYYRYYKIGQEIIPKWDIKKYSIIINKGQERSLVALAKYILPNKSNITCNKYGASTINRDIFNPNNKVDDREIYSNVSLQKIAKNTEYLSKIAHICESKGIELVLVAFPITENFSQSINFEANNDIVMDVVSGILEQYNNVKFFNYQDDKRFSNKDFKNYDHLNYNGAKKFSIILWKDIAK